MKISNELLDRAKRKAQATHCTFKICAIGFDHNGRMIGIKNNSSRFSRKGGGVHSEMKLMAQYKKNLKTILICRTGGNGNLLPIDPCKMCKEKADELGIKIISIIEEK